MLERSNGAQTRGNNEVDETRFLFLQIWLIRSREQPGMSLLRIRRITIPLNHARNDLEIENHLARYLSSNSSYGVESQ